MWRTRVGLLIVALLCVIALFGRYIAPYGEREAVGLPFKPSGKTRKDALFGSANVGHDVWTRFLYGGKPILIAAVSGDGAGVGARHDRRADRGLQPRQARRRADAIDGRDPGPAADHLGVDRDLDVRRLDRG